MTQSRPAGELSGWCSRDAHQRCTGSYDRVCDCGCHGTAGERLDAITRDLDATTQAWAETGYGYSSPEHEAREAVFARLRAWNEWQAGR